MTGGSSSSHTRQREQRHRASSQVSSSQAPNTSEESIHLSDTQDEEQGHWRVREVEERDKEGRICIVRRWVRWNRSDLGPVEHLLDPGTGGRPAQGRPYTTSIAPSVGQSFATGGGGYPPQNSGPRLFGEVVNPWKSGLPDDPSGFTNTPVAGSYSTSRAGDEKEFRVDDDATTYSMSETRQRNWNSGQYEQYQGFGFVEGGRGQGSRPHAARAGQWCSGGRYCAGRPRCRCPGGEQCHCDD